MNWMPCPNQSSPRNVSISRLNKIPFPDSTFDSPGLLRISAFFKKIYLRQCGIAVFMVAVKILINIWKSFLGLRP